MVSPDLPVGTEIRSPHGNRWKKVGDNIWLVRKEWGVLDHWTTYSDTDVYGEIIDD